MTTNIDFYTVFPNFGKIVYMYNHKHSIYNNNVFLLLKAFKQYYEESEFQYEDIVFSRMFEYINDAFGQFEESLEINYLNSAERLLYTPQFIDGNKEYKQLEQLNNQYNNQNTQNNNCGLLYKTSIDDDLQKIKILHNNKNNKITTFLTKFANAICTMDVYYSNDDDFKMFSCIDSAFKNYKDYLYFNVYEELSNISQSSRYLSDISLEEVQLANGDIEYKYSFEQEYNENQDLTQKNNILQNATDEMSDNLTISYALTSDNSNGIIRNKQKILEALNENNNDSLYSSSFSSIK